jgi:hypothetical protein
MGEWVSGQKEQEVRKSTSKQEQVAMFKGKEEESKE